MRRNTTRFLYLFAFGLWFAALVSIIGVYLMIRANAESEINIDFSQQPPREAAIQAVVTSAATLQATNAPQENLMFNPQGIPFPGNSLDHSFFPLEGSHSVIDCESCHKDFQYAGTPTNCISCHAGAAPQDHYAGDCVSCHIPTTWSDIYFDHGVVNTANCQSCHTPPNKHFSGQCSNCHVTSNWASVNFDHTGLTNCQECHSPPNNHFSGQCSSCHVTSNWASVNFDHTGLTNCQECHTPPSNHFSGQCSSCHNTKDWDDAEFDHAGQTNCLSCHRNDEPDEDDHPSGQQCSDCHNTRDWDDVEENDSLTTTASSTGTEGAHSDSNSNEALSLDSIKTCATCHEE